MLLIVLLAAGGLFWAWKKGHLKGYTLDDGIAAAVFLLGLRLLTTGTLGAGAALMAGSILWAIYRRPRRKSPSMPIEEARALLGVGEEANLADIRAAHRRLITRVHPDAGGSDELAHRVNVARDTLISELNRRNPRAS